MILLMCTVPTLTGARVSTSRKLANSRSILIPTATRMNTKMRMILDLLIERHSSNSRVKGNARPSYLMKVLTLIPMAKRNKIAVADTEHTVDIRLILTMLNPPTIDTVGHLKIGMLNKTDMLNVISTAIQESLTMIGTRSHTFMKNTLIIILIPMTMIYMHRTMVYMENMQFRIHSIMVQFTNRVILNMIHMQNKDTANLRIRMLTEQHRTDTNIVGMHAMMNLLVSILTMKMSLSTITSVPSSLQRLFTVVKNLFHCGVEMGKRRDVATAKSVRTNGSPYVRLVLWSQTATFAHRCAQMEQLTMTECA